MYTVLGNAINYLTSTQSADRRWLQDPYSTALALRALTNVKPNLLTTQTDITFSNPNPTVGDTINITATIKNTSPAQAENVAVQFYSNDLSSSGILIGESVISLIAANSSSQSAISWTIPSAFAYNIYVKIDPLNSIDELNENFVDKIQLEIV